MKADKDLYRELRNLPPEILWKEEVARFDRASPKERNERVAVIRAVGVVFAAAGSARERADVKAWLLRLLDDPSEKIRRYAMAAIPKLRGVEGAESTMISLLKRTTVERERRYVGRALDKIGGAATLEAVSGLLPQTELKVRASVARVERPSVVLMDRPLVQFDGLHIHLRCRKGLESFVREELEELHAKRKQFALVEVRGRHVAVRPTAPFTLGDLYQLRCFATIGFSIGAVKRDGAAGALSADTVDRMAAAITSPLSRRILNAFTEGALRYRLQFDSRSHQRGVVRQLATRAYALCPELLNDPRRAPWSVDIYELPQATYLELRPRLHPDPRFRYRLDDVPAASHPPLAACMARLAGREEGDVVWDPFCGSGLELIERALRGGVKTLIGSDVSPEAIEIARANVNAAALGGVASRWVCGDFRDALTEAGAELSPGRVTLVISNPPMGRRVRIPDMRALYETFFAVAARALAPGGRLVFPNPLRLAPKDPSLRLEFRQAVDLGGFTCALEKYRKL
jgi:23S rRNA G2445 N2-methylase RlmL